MRQEATGNNRKSKLVRCVLRALYFAFGFMNFFLLYPCSVLGVTCSAGAQQQKLPRIGFLAGSPPAALSSRIDAFRNGLRERGYTEGKNIIVEYRYGDGKLRSEERRVGKECRSRW